ncbi:MAG TPA: SH3 domain-containing protein [Xanthobacteraceae bacterium]|nr:SH3 domain-containing protein [Xanthobacteraceae bacterium]
MRPLAVLAWVLIPAVLGNGALRAEDSRMTTMRFVIVKSRAAEAPQAKPYAAVAVKPPLALSDASLDAFRAKLAAVAKRRVYAELAELVTPQGFFWDRDFAGEFAGRLSSVDNLAAALRLEQHDGSGWNTLAAFADEPTAAPLVGRPGIVCTPGEPSLDNLAFDRLLDATASEARNWAYPHAENTPVRASPETNAPVVDRLELALVRVLDRSPGWGKADDVGTGWTRVATPAGRVGFVAPGALRPLSPERLCYGRDVFGRWRIAGYIGTE